MAESSGDTTKNFLGAGLLIEPDLDKAPPHVEGELLIRQKTRAVLPKSKWNKRFFVVRKDKLHCYAKKEDYKLSKEPSNIIRLMWVKDITEAVFNGVPKKHHINCGFSIIEVLPRGEEIVFDLLAESPDLMRYWVHGLCYIRSYWKKMEVRETVLNDEQERKLLESLFKDDDDDGDVYVGEYFVDEDHSGTSDLEPKQIYIPVNFADGNKISVAVNVRDHVSDMMEKLHDRLTSSKCEIWAVSNTGREIPLKRTDDVVLCHPSSHQFFMVDPSHRVLVVYIGGVTKEFSTILVPYKITAQEVIEHPSISPKLDIIGMDNRGLFLQKDNENLLFDATECPCEALYLENEGKINRLQIGNLVIKNKLSNEGRLSTSLRQTIRVMRKSTMYDSSTTILEEEDDHRRALDKIQRLRDGKVPTPTAADQKKTNNNANSSSSSTPPLPRTIVIDSNNSTSPRLRTRSKAFLRASLTNVSDDDISPRVSPRLSRRKSPEVVNNLDKADDKTKQDTISQGGGDSPLQRRPATRRSGSKSPPKMPKNTQNRRKPPIENICASIDVSRSSGFGQVTEKVDDDEDESIDTSTELEKIFDIDSQVVEPQEQTDTMTIDTSITKNDLSPVEEDIPLPTSPLIIKLLKDTKLGSSNDAQGLLPINVPKPSILKVILLQMQGSTTADDKSDATKCISLSGVNLKHINNEWHICNGHHYHDPPPEGDNTETHVLPGGIRAVYNLSSNCWHVLPPPPPVVQHKQEEDVQQDSSSVEPRDEVISAFYQRKRAIVTHIGSAFNEVLEIFSKSKSTDEKKRLGSDMTNERLGHMVRGAFCTNIASLILDGVKLQRFGGLIQHDIWKLITSFHQEDLELFLEYASKLDSLVMKPIKAENRLTDCNMRFRSFICLAISRGLFLEWLEKLPTHGETLQKYYTKDSFLYLVYSGDQHCCKLYKEVLLTLQPMSFVPFQLSIDFEIKIHDSTDGTPRNSPPVEHQQEKTVTVTPTSIINTNHSPLLRGNGQFSYDSNTAATKVNATNNTSTSSIANTTGPKWLKKLAKNLENLNVGGALTGAPKVPKLDVTWTAVALYDCEGDNEDELSFKKGDVIQVKQKINSEWLLCQLNNRTGIVPVTFVQPV